MINNTSFGLVRTNPKLTTNVKLVYNGKNLYLESFNANSQLSNSAYKNFKISGNSTYDHDVYRFYNSGLNTPANIAYSVFEEFDEKTILSSFDNQYEMMYNMGVRAISSEAYDEDMGLLFPIWINKDNIPNYFVIFRLDGPTSVDYKNIENEVNDRNTFNDNILNNATIIKTFDLTENSLLGSYIRRYVNQSNFPKYPIYATFNENEPWEWRGISFKKGGFSKGSKYVYEDLIIKDASLIENEYYITQGFERNEIICANLLNIEFLFSDEDVNDYSINRYFGFYVNELDESWFDIDGEQFFKCPDYKQYPRFNKEASKIDKNLDESLYITNPDGVLMFIDKDDSKSIRTNNNFLSSEEVNARNSIFYVKDKFGNFHSIKKSNVIEWSENQLRLKETNIDISLFTGFKKPDTFASCKVVDMPGVATACIEILGEINEQFYIEFNDSSYIGYDWEDYHGENEHSLIFSETVPVSETNYMEYTHYYNAVYGRLKDEHYTTISNDYVFTEGGNYYQYFCVSGNPVNVAKSIANAINIGIDDDHRFFVAEAVNNMVFIKAKFAGERMNSLRMRIPNIDRLPIKLYYVNNDNNISYFIGGTSYEKSILGINKNDHLRFAEGKYVKTRTGYAKILGYLPYTEYPEYDDDRNIIGYKDIDKYELIFCSEGHIEVPNNNVIPLYEDFKCSIGRFSFFPIKDFDFDIYSNRYNNCYDIIEEIKYYTTDNSINNELNKNPDIIKFYENNINGFSNLKNLNFENFDNNQNEYDRLNEKYIKELATVSKVVPFINKWSYCNDAKDVRDKPYRLDINLAFGQYNFSPSSYYDSSNIEAFSHEWYYILGIPPYFLDDELEYEQYEHLYNYIFDIGGDIIDNLKNVDENYFLKYFIFDNIVNNNGDRVVFTPSIKYSEFNDGDIENFAQTFFRGVKVIVKELASELNYNDNYVNVNSISYKHNSKYNGYKFSCILTKYDETKIFIIKNEKWKTITLVCCIQYDIPENAWFTYLDRTILYSAISEYDKNKILDGEEPEESIVNKDVNDRLVYISTENEGYAVVRGTEIGANISTSIQGVYNSIQFVHENNTFLIEFDENGSIEVDDFSSTAYLYNFKLKNITDPSNEYYVFDEFEYIDSPITLYKGYKNYYRNKFSNIGFKNIYENVNSFNFNNIEYIVVKEDGTTSNNTDFAIELVQQNNILKSKYITSILDENKPSSFNFNENIGYSLSIDNISIIPISRHNGYYTPLFYDCLYFADIFIKEQYETDENIISLCRHNNSEFNIKNENFAIIKNMFYHKVNEENAGGILEFSSESAFESVYPLINEIGINFRDFYIFNSNWDPNYFIKNSDRDNYEFQHGTKSMLEKKSFFASKYMKLPNSINIEMFTPCKEFDLKYIEYQNYENINGHYMYNEDSVITFYVFLKKRLKEYLYENIYPVFEKYICPMYSYNNTSNIQDDVYYYIENNILKLYKIQNIYFFTKDTRENIPNVYNTTMLPNSIKLQAGLEVNNSATIENINNEFDFKLSFNKKEGYSEYFGLSVLLTKK
ncbi:hypothetical protein [uncultured Methanobrevibacter sp.]|uniref:hypothetical protein n=1 Tax=uncultured Methanobrevibacter sp. TaxID=253161 RepID=UPI0025F0E9C1|nr:hypothetical protein [uncultured Methanobrevibacter sp.]